jgi:chaperone modulatory protein CbpM
MLSETALVATIPGLDAQTLRRWIDHGWICPCDDGDEVSFDGTDIARVRLVYELRMELEIDENSLPVVLSLLDQLYASRRAFNALSTAVQAQPPEVRALIDAALRAADR